MYKDASPENISSGSITQRCREVKPEARRFGVLAAESAVEEVMTAPKPGLVDPLGCGCHKDMNVDTFMASCRAIAPYWELQAEVGANGTSPNAALAALRSAGIEMERAMFAATGGVNTHKGLIYLLSLLLYGAGRSTFLKESVTPERITGHAAACVAGITERELAPLKKRGGVEGLTHGELLYVLHGVTGVRGEAEKGFPSVLRAGLPELFRARAAGASDNSAALSALLAIMEVNEDSNVMHRGGFEFWRGEYREKVRRAREKFDATRFNCEPLEELERAFIPLRISPGGAADLLSCTLFIKKVVTPTCQH